MGYLIDSNVIFDYLGNAFSKSQWNFLVNVINESPNISVITKIEALSWHDDSIQEETKLASFINYSNIIPLSDDIVAQCINIRRNRKMKTPDAIIAATALVYNFTLITSDSDFNKIPDIKTINPF